MADSVPLKLAGGLHALVLSDQDADVAAYHPCAPDPNDDPLTDAIRTVVTRHSSHLLHWIGSPPQTNEAGHSGAILPAGLWLSKQFCLPLYCWNLAQATC